QAGNEKASARARGLQFYGRRKGRIRFEAKALLVGCRTSLASLSGGRGSLAEALGVSRIGVDTDKATLPDLQQRSSERGAREVEVVDNGALELDPALGDHPPRVARREAEARRDQGRQVHRVAVRQRERGHLLGRAALPDDAREVRLGGCGRLLPVGTPDDEPRE